MADSLDGGPALNEAPLLARAEPLHPALPGYAELHVQSAFSFRRGASRPTELVERAHALGYQALALTDEASVAGVVQAHARAQQLGLQFIPGVGFDVTERWRLLLLPTAITGWGDLCEFITAQRSAPPAQQRPLNWSDVEQATLRDCEAILVPKRLGRHHLSNEALLARAVWLNARFAGHAWLALELLHAMDDALWLQRLRWVEAHSGVPLLATGDVQLHLRSRKPLHDVLTALRQGRSVHDCGDALHPNAEAHLRSRERLSALYPPDTLARTLELASRCRFSLNDIRYQYPTEPLQAYAGRGWNATQVLRHTTAQGALQRYPQGVPASVQQQIEHELALITELRYEMYFLTVHDLVLFARSRGILCQGRGSAANSVVCFCLGITEVDPARMSTLFERFISRERREPPDIDVDFEHQRREEVIQYIYSRYGRDRAALAATVIHYQPRSALREAARALGVPPAWADAVARQHFWFDGHGIQDAHTTQRLIDAGLDPQAPLVQRWLHMAAELLGLPRHLSQHVGGFVLTQGKLTRLVPVEHAAMPERSIIQWDKDDLDAMGLLKVDVLALGMLSAIRRCLELVSAWRGQPLRLQDIPDGDVPTYDMICAADTVGVFQIESRAQMAMLPRLRPRSFYDLVIEVAIVRPGPIQGGMVHPYLKRRRQLEPVTYPSEALRQALGRTLGVPIFQEQVMQIAMLAAGFSADEADQLRRSMAAWKRKGGVHHFYDRIVGGMVERGYTAEFAQQIFSQIEGFGEYGFPESHAASFALLVYASCWLKCHEPACFLAAMLNAQPLGFYSPSQLVQDARRHGVQVRAVDVSSSDWDCTLEWPDEVGTQAAPVAHVGQAAPAGMAANGADGRPPQPAVRLGLRLVKGLSEAGARRLVKAREQVGEQLGAAFRPGLGAAAPATSSASPPARHATWRDVDDLAQSAALDQRDLQALAAADALASLAGHRREQVWQARAWQAPAPLLAEAVIEEDPLRLPEAPEGEAVVLDHQHTGLSLRRHPLALLRSRLDAQRWLRASDLQALGDGTRVRACGLVTMRQQPVTAKGVVFVTLEDESGCTNVIVWKALRERQRQELLHARLLGVQGRWQRDEETGGQVRHLVAQRLYDLTPWLGLLAEAAPSSRDFH